MVIRIDSINAERFFWIDAPRAQSDQVEPLDREENSVKQRDSARIAIAWDRKPL
jgi:hypothetical protein